MIIIIIMIITKLATGTCVFSVPQPANAKNLGSFQVLCEEWDEVLLINLLLSTCDISTYPFPDISLVKSCSHRSLLEVLSYVYSVNLQKKTQFTFSLQSWVYEFWSRC